MTAANITTKTPSSLIKSKQDKHKMSEIDENISKLFEIKKRLGKGAYGIVWKALDKRTCETLAVKKIFDAFRDETDAQRTFREIVFLKALRNHPNIIQLHSVYKATNNLDIYLIFEYMESDLHNIIKKGTILKDVHKRYVMYQLINAIKYIHSGNIIHRDLKPSNVLIDSKCRCKLADFGLARSVSNQPVRNTIHNNKDNDSPPQPLLTDYVATRWYRAPEILVASKTYTKGIDMWSLGCILGEMLRGKPLFQGSSTINQIEKIVAALPEITDHDIDAVGASFGSVLLSKQISRDKKTPLCELIRDASKDAFDMVKSLLVLDPLGRLTAKQALNHPYVERFRNSIPEVELTFDILPPFRDDVRLSVPEYRSKLYEIVQIATEKNVRSNNQSSKERDPLKNSVRKNFNNTKTLINVEEKPFNTKRENNDELSKQQQAQEKTTILNHSTNSINGALKKSNSVTLADTKRRPSGKTSLKPITNDTNNNKMTENGAFKRSRSCSQQPVNKLNKPLVRNGHVENVSHGSQPLITNMNDINESTEQKQSTTFIRKTDTALCLNRTDKTNNDQFSQNSMAILKGPLGNKLCRVRNVKSDVIIPRETCVETGNAPVSTSAKTINNKTMADSNCQQHKTPERMCYDRRLKKLEEEIERYKKEVKTFCQENYPDKKEVLYRQASQDNLWKRQLTEVMRTGDKVHHNNNNLNNNQNNNQNNNNVKKSTTISGTNGMNGINSTYTNVSGNLPIKNTYFQLVTKSRHRQKSEIKIELDLSGSNSSSDHNLLKRQCNTANRYRDNSSRIKGTISSSNNKYNSNSNNNNNYNNNNNSKKQQPYQSQSETQISNQFRMNRPLVTKLA